MSGDFPRLGITDEPGAAYYQAVLGEASNSGLKHVAISPAHYRAWVEAPRKAVTPEMAFGSAFHAYVLEPGEFARAYAVAPVFGDLRTNAAKAKRDAWLDEHRHQEAIGQDDFDTIRRMVDAVLAHPVARNLFIGGRREVTLRWIDDRTKLPCKARVDYWLEEMRLAVDLKSTANASPRLFGQSSAKLRYHCQDVFYTEGFRACGKPLEQFLFVNVEKEAPYGVSVVYHDDQARDRGNALIARDMDTLSACVESQAWPCYSDDIECLSLPNWAFFD